MNFEQDWSVKRTIALIGSVGALSVIPGAGWLVADAQTTYPDVPADYWAQPFIQQLSDADILAGYLDGTFRPEQAMDRDEYAAVIRQAFEAEPVRSIPEASTFEDVPENYWANDAIEEAYETGFMGTPQPNEFEPTDEISRADAIVALVEGLGMTEPETVAVPAAAESVQPVQSGQARSAAPSFLAFPLASTSIMQLFAPPAQATPAPPAAQADNPQVDEDNTAEIDLSEYYIDADQIPDYARDEVAIATESGIIVNHPQPNQLQPNEAITRGAAAAMVHQALVHQGKMEPLTDTATVSE
ncbi:S-layer homology domain-containing protein [Oscillatoria sp. CS-180]|uniref:S-layer homology domain-containing protein n=1 Tax=Oscillatoria sp. CS-180 TaxID=3021720 RepID=UPI00232DF2AF|nr:S-layer homology domain-containing protein [Oscillatoria sp. CS-180]MDB9524847.1 S-layer homology domain-containing protein [Oscillatoria sp. CS-180]